MEDFINKLKEEIAKEPVWASLSIIELIDKLTESQTIFYQQVDGITPSVIRTEPKKAHTYCDRCNHISCITCKGDKNDPYCVPSNYEPCIDRSTE